MDALKTALKIVIQKSAEETGDLLGNKIEDIITESAPETALRKIYFCEQCLGTVIFHFFIYFIPGNSRQNKAQLLDIPQNCAGSLINSKAKNKDPWKSHIIFSWSTL